MASLIRIAFVSSLLLPSAVATAQPTTPPPSPPQSPSPDPGPSPDPSPSPDLAPSPVPAPSAPLPLSPAPAPTPSDEPTGQVSFKDGFTLSDGDDYAVTLNLRVQSRYELLSLDQGDSRDERSAFSIARARLGLKGHVYDPRLKYKFQADFGKGFVTLKDFYADWKLGDGIIVRAGQWKRPFSRQQITSSGDLELVDRALTDKAFLGSRDIGVALHNDYEKSPDLEWAVGVFNGTGEAPVFGGDVTVDPATGEGEVSKGGFSNVPALFGPALVARIGLNRGGIKGYKEADLEGGPLRFSVALSTLAELDADDNDASSTRHEIDGVVKVEGLSATGGIYVASAQDGDGFADQRYAATGFHLQVGKVVADKVQPVLRYAFLNPDGADNNQQELTAGLSLYQFKHGFKWQTDVSWLGNDVAGGRADDLRARSQLQLAF